MQNRPMRANVRQKRTERLAVEKTMLQKLPEALLPWFDRNKRDLPWRRDREPYHVWLSEIMLQQTRVEAVKEYYTRFLRELPTIADLAVCDDARLYKLWEGLGYYSRVRNMKKAAQTIQERHGGQFPRDYEAILALPGIGAYTAGAICSISFDQKRAAVDGNVLRVYARLQNDATPIDDPRFRAQVSRALETVYPQRAGDFTQALMELGATVCGPNRAPQCALCPCRDFCRAYHGGTAQDLPVKSPKKEKKQQARTVFILECDDRFALEKRPDSGLLASLWQFPNVAGTLDTAQAVAWAQSHGMAVRDVCRQSEKKHIFTHIIWNMRGFYLRVAQENDDFSWFTAAQINENAALPTAFRQFWEAGET